MPVSPKLAMRLALELRGLYEAATNDLIRAIAVQVGRGAQDATWQDRKLEALTLLMHDVDRTIDDLRREVPGAVERALGYAYRRAVRRRIRRGGSGRHHRLIRVHARRGSPHTATVRSDATA